MDKTREAIENLLGRQNELNNKEFYNYILGALHLAYKVGLISLTERILYSNRAEEKFAESGLVEESRLS